MSTSDRTVAFEAAAAAALTAGAVALASPDDVWLSSVGMHPGWLPVIVLAARYGTRGLFTALAFTTGALIVAGALLGGGLDSALAGLTARPRAGSDLMALASATLVAWMAMMHETRLGRVTAQLAEATEGRAAAETTVTALHDSLSYLRRRHDRLDISLSLWRDVAARVESGEPADAAKAILELCEIRLGATAGLVQLRDGNRLTTLTSRGAWSPTSARPRDIAVDVTVREAVVARRVTPAGASAGEDDSDVAVPVLDEASDVVLGVIALRGVAPSALRSADLADLRVLAQWLAPALARSQPTSAPRRRPALGGSSDFDQR